MSTDHQTAQAHADAICEALRSQDRPALFAACVRAFGVDATTVLTRLPDAAGLELIRALQWHRDELQERAIADAILAGAPLDAGLVPSLAAISNAQQAKRP